MIMNIFAILLLTSLASNLIALKMFESHNVNFDKEMIHGLHRKKQSEIEITFSNSFAACIRLKVKRIARDNSVKLLVIEKFFYLYAQYPETWFLFGNSNQGKGYKGSWILYDPVENSYMTWRLNKWHHICFSYSKQTSHISLVKVSSKQIVNKSILP